MSVMTSQIQKFVNSLETLKFKYHENETFVLQIKKIMAQYGEKNYFLASVTLKLLLGDVFMV